MAPTVVRDGPFRLFFFSREEPRMHVHVAHPDGEAKFWLEPSLVLADHIGLSQKELTAAEEVVRRHLQEITNAWNRHFGR
jgi:ribosomal protein L16/L10AE